MEKDREDGVLTPTMQLVCQPSWMRDEMAVSGVPMHHSFGIEVPNFEADDIWWMPQGFAVEMNHALDHYGLRQVVLSAPGPELLPGISKEFTGRTIRLLSAEEALANPVEGWWKSAEAKIENFPSAYRTAVELVNDIKDNVLPADSVLHHTDTLLSIAREFRSFIAHDKVLSTSVYLVANEGVQTTVYDGAEALPGDIERVHEFLDNLIKSVALPPSVVADVAILETGEIILLEFNPSWCSAWYNNDINAVVECIGAGFHLSPAELSKWKYEPDPYFVAKVSRRAILPLR
jgi:hypothetical protein